MFQFSVVFLGLLAPNLLSGCYYPGGQYFISNFDEISKICTLITVSAKFEFTASRGALKFRKPYNEKQSSSSYSETIGPILMIPLADLHANWMPMKGWKNQSSSISERKRARSYHYVLRPVGHQKLLQMQKFQRETWRQCQKCFRNKYIEPFNLLLLFVYCHF